MDNGVKEASTNVLVLTRKGVHNSCNSWLLQLEDGDWSPVDTPSAWFDP